MLHVSNTAPYLLLLCWASNHFWVAAPARMSLSSPGGEARGWSLHLLSQWARSSFTEHRGARLSPPQHLHADSPWAADLPLCTASALFLSLHATSTVCDQELLAPVQCLLLDFLSYTRLQRDHCMAVLQIVSPSPASFHIYHREKKYDQAFWNRSYPLNNKENMPCY